MGKASAYPPELLSAAAALARVTLTPAEIEEQLRTLMPLLSELDGLRKLPLKDCEPPLVFRPIEA
ncbi:MAG: hypothetical protein K0S81_1956 [Rhodospirillales bacterium]|nr:hypothetical protein [Rhodospirillales bacterium]